jgi:nicotinate-nucleotide adenylyltransferase
MSSSVKKVGIFAGTFDPVHDGHIKFAKSALSHGLDKVFLLVEPRPRRKQGVKSLQHRFAMAKIATEKHDGVGVILLEQARFTPRETLPALQKRFQGAEVVFMFGDDVISRMVDNLPEWPYVEELLESSKLLIASRHYEKEVLSSRLKDLSEYGLNIDYDFVDCSHDSSSSKIRLAIKNGDNPDGLNKDVRSYIDDNGLYSSLESC